MRTRLRWFSGLLILLCCFSAATARMQQADGIAPDLTGLNVPQAAAALNRAGLALGATSSAAWSEASGLPQNTISAQSAPAGSTLAIGAAVDVTVLRSPNVVLSYDDNDFTLINNTGVDLDLTGLIFGVAEGSNPAAFAATRWSGALSAGGCVQVWSVIRSAPKDVDGCARINAWLTTNNAAEYFWTALNGVTRFTIVQDGIERATCPAAPAATEPLRCDITLAANAANAADEVTPYVYFAYTPERLILHNRSETQFMALTETPLYNNNPSLAVPGSRLDPSDSGLYRLLNPVASVARLAPGQCILFTNSAQPDSAATPEPCDVIARLDIDPTLIFWMTPFDLDSATDGQRRTCPAATAGRLTLCVMPR